jgi:hypothetical protein
VQTISVFLGHQIEAAHESEVTKMHFAKSLLGLVIILLVFGIMGPALRLTDDIALRVLMPPLFFALFGLGLALMYFNRGKL